MLFVDNPVGTGFSYTESPGGYATNVATVASDMLVLLKHFFTERPEFQVRQLDGNKCLLHCSVILSSSTKNQESQRMILLHSWAS